METLRELLPSIRSLRAREAIRFSDGIRTEIGSYQELDGAIARFATCLKARAWAPETACCSGVKIVRNGLPSSVPVSARELWSFRWMRVRALRAMA